MNYARFMTDIAKARQQSELRIFAKYLIDPSPSLINMSAGYPNPKTFPYKSAELHLKNGPPIEISHDKMKTALQYSSSQGMPKLLKWLNMLQTEVHKPPTSSSTDSNNRLEILVSPGSQDAIVRAMECLLNPGDSIILEEPTYPGSLAFMKPQGYNFIQAQGDGDGIIPESILEAFSKWTPQHCRSTVSMEIPRVLYLIPTAGNPTGTTISLERRRQIYKIAQDYDLMIIEDDPYYFLHFDNKQRPQSFLSLDTDGRVIRTDSFSKILSSGMRVGFVSGPNAIMQKILMHMQATVSHTSGISQLMIAEVLEYWGLDGFMNHIQSVQEFYLNQRDITMKYADKWLKGLAEWNVPSGGMFLWITIPGLADTTELVTKNLVQKEMIIAPGRVFMFNKDKPCQNIRVAFSFATEEQIDEGFRRLAEAIKEEMNKQI